MTKFALLATIAFLSIANASAAHAQAAIQEPGAYAFYHPDGDVLRTGRQYGLRFETYGPVGAANAMIPVPAVGRRTHGRRRVSTQ